MFWDDDVTVVGLAAGWSSGGLSVIGAGFGLPAGMKAFSGNLGAIQVVYDFETSGPSWTLAAAYYAIEGDPDDPDAALLRNGNGVRDFGIAVVSAQARLDVADRPLVLGVDLLHNRENYGADDPFAYGLRDETDGGVVSARWGRTSEAGDWSNRFPPSRTGTGFGSTTTSASRVRRPAAGPPPE